jgi:hypothetical protein
MHRNNYIATSPPTPTPTTTNSSQQQQQLLQPPPQQQQHYNPSSVVLHHQPSSSSTSPTSIQYHQKSISPLYLPPHQQQQQQQIFNNNQLPPQYEQIERNYHHPHPGPIISSNNNNNSYPAVSSTTHQLPLYSQSSSTSSRTSSSSSTSIIANTGVYNDDPDGVLLQTFRFNTTASNTRNIPPPQQQQQQQTSNSPHPIQSPGKLSVGRYPTSTIQAQPHPQEAYCHVKIVNGRFDELGECWLDEGQKKIHILVETNLNRAHIQKCTVYCEKETNNKRSIIFSVPSSSGGVSTLADNGNHQSTSATSDQTNTGQQHMSQQTQQPQKGTKRKRSTEDTEKFESSDEHNNSDFEYYDGAWKFIYRCQKGFPVKSGITHSPLRFIAVIQLFPNAIPLYSNKQNNSQLATDTGQLTFISKKFFMYSKLPEAVKLKKQQKSAQISKKALQQQEEDDVLESGTDDKLSIASAEDVDERASGTRALSPSSPTIIAMLEHHSKLLEQMQLSQKSFQHFMMNQMSQLASITYPKSQSDIFIPKDTIDNIHLLILSRSDFEVDEQVLATYKRRRSNPDSSNRLQAELYRITNQWNPLRASDFPSGIVEVDSTDQIGVQFSSSESQQEMYWFCMYMDTVQRTVKHCKSLDRNRATTTEQQFEFSHGYQIDLSSKYLNEITNDCWKMNIRTETTPAAGSQQLVLLKFFGISRDLYHERQNMRQSDLASWSICTKAILFKWSPDHTMQHQQQLPLKYNMMIEVVPRS